MASKEAQPWEVRLDIGSSDSKSSDLPRQLHGVRLLALILVAAAMTAVVAIAIAATMVFDGNEGEMGDNALKIPRVLSPVGNPFDGPAFYVNPSYRSSLLSSIETAEGTVKATMESMLNVSSAYWIDVKAKISGAGTGTVEGILTDAASASPSKLVVFIVYDLPNRDCHAKASNGEICCTYDASGLCDYMAAGNCEDGIAQYKETYIDPLANVLRQFDGIVPIVLVIEPDSLPNLSTNQADPRCGNTATGTAYRQGVAYAVKTLAEAAPSAAIYLDAGHGGWLGWRDNMVDFVATVQGLGVAEQLRGFATNVAGYQPIGRLCPAWDWCLPFNNNLADPCCADPCGLTGKYDPSQNELNYALHLRTAISDAIPGFMPFMIIDTGRNGVADMRQDCANWCNIRGAGVGLLPTSQTAAPELVDAYYWLKTPGESDGCTATLPNGQSCRRFDSDCASRDSVGSQEGEPRAPEAGLWFDYQIKQLAANAHMTAS